MQHGASRRAPGRTNGSWDLVFVTQRGACDPSYNFTVNINDGIVSHPNLVKFRGYVARSGAVRASASVPTNTLPARAGCRAPPAAGLGVVTPEMRVARAIGRLAAISNSPRRSAVRRIRELDPPYRLIVRKTGPRLRIFTRGGADWSQSFLAGRRGVRRLRVSSILVDGVVCGADAPGRRKLPVYDPNLDARPIPWNDPAIRFGFCQVISAAKAAVSDAFKFVSVPAPFVVFTCECRLSAKAHFC
jgi:hypothetical protein